MATKRKKKTLITGVGRPEAEQAMAAYAKAAARRDKIAAEMELQMVRIREKRQEELARLGAEMEEAFGVLQAYATEHRAELFPKKKSVEMAHGSMGFRTGTPKLKTLRGFTWDSALNLVREYLPGFVRTTEEIAKDKLLSESRREDVAANMAKCGIMVTQDEKFFVEPKREGAAEG